MEVDIKMPDVYEEFDQIRRKHGIRNFGCKFVKRNYAFEVPGVPAESDYLKVVYGFDRMNLSFLFISAYFAEPSLPADLKGQTFSRVFGTGTSALELLILKRKLMGPCWVKIEKAQLSAAAVRPTLLEAVF